MSRQPGGVQHSKVKHGSRRISAKGLGQDPKTNQEPISRQPRSKHAAGSVKPGLYVVATPIGNLADVTLRAIETLAASDVIACEDTRVTAKLLRAHSITTPTVPYHDHNATRAGPSLLRRLAAGQTIALVSDAGTPLISDPGFKLVREATARGIYISAVPGASAPLMALVLSGLPSDRFFYAGFLPQRKSARRAELIKFAAIEATLVLLESPRRLAASLTDMVEILGRRDVCVARELTKLHEELRRGALEDIAAHYRDAATPKGEVVVIVGPPVKDAAEVSDDIDARLEVAILTMSVRDAAAMVAEACDVPRRTVYARALELTSSWRGG